MHDHFCARLKVEAAKSLDCTVQWDRTFKTNSDPLYRSFVRWQMRLLREQGRIGWCQRPMVYRVGRGRIVPIHERGFVGGYMTALKEGIPRISTYIAIRQELLLGEDATHPRPSSPPSSSSASSQLKALLDRHNKIYVVSLCHKALVERVFRQTGCIINAKMDLGAYVVLGRRLHHRHHADEHDGDQWVVICSEVCAQHMAHQGFVFATTASSSADTTTTKLVKLAELKGQDLVGLSARCPIAGQQEASVPFLAVSVHGEGNHLPRGKREALVAQVLASPDAFPHSQAQSQVQTTNDTEEPCIAALMDSYFLDLVSVDETGTEWKAQVLDLVDSMSRQGRLQWNNLLSKVRKTKRWYVGSYESEGTCLPWDDSMVVTPPCEQALLHAYFVVAPIVKGMYLAGS